MSDSCRLFASGLDLALRPAEAADAGLVHRLSADAYIPAYQAVIGAVPKPATEDYTERIARDEVWVLEQGRERVPTPVGVLVAEAADEHLAIYSIAVAPAWQGRGFGKALLALAEQLARRRRLPELRLYTNTRMTKNVALYRAAGFVETGTRVHPGRPGEFLVDMARRVG